MTPLKINRAITVLQFLTLSSVCLLLLLVWMATAQYFHEGLFFILGAYLLLGPMLLPRISGRRQQGSDLFNRVLSHVLGLGLLTILLNFAWWLLDNPMEAVRAGLTVASHKPEQMAALALGTMGIAGLLGRSSTLVARFRSRQLRPVRPPSQMPMSPILMSKASWGNPQPPLDPSSPPLPSRRLAPIPSRQNPNPERPKERLDSEGKREHLPRDLDPSLSGSQGQSVGLSIPKPIESSKLKQIQEDFSSLTGLSLFSYSPEGETLCAPSLENPICTLVQITAKGLQHCRSHCGKSVGLTLQSGEPFFFKCDAGLHVFTIPIIADKENPRSNMALLGGKAYFDRQEYTNFQNQSRNLDVPPNSLSHLKDPVRVVDSKAFVSSARLLESVLPPLATTVHENNIMAIKSARLMSLFNLFSQISDERPFKQHAAVLLDAVGVLFGIRTASMMLLDPQEKRYKTEAVFGEKARQLARCSASSLSGLFGDLQEKMGPVVTGDTLKILKTGLPAEISSARFFPLLVRHENITGVLAVFDTSLTEEEVSVILSFCRQVTVCQEIKQLRTERQELAKDMSVLLEIAKTVGSALESEDLFGIILEKSVGFLDAEQGSLLLMDEEREELTVKAMKGLNKKIVELLRIRPGEGISGKVFSTGTPLLVSDIENDNRIAQVRRPRYKTKSFISIPLRLNGRIFGVLNIADKTTGDVFSEDDLHILLSIGTYASVAIERSQLYHKTQELKKISITDSLTGLLNRRYFQERISEEIERSRRHHLPLSLIMIDLDNFKDINDTYGHIIGDEVLKISARCLRNCVRTIDVAARYGGEEFTIILPQTGKMDASVIANRICHEVSKLDFPFEKMGRRTPLTVSLGLATFPDDAEGIETLIRNADVALYLAKTQGKNRVILYGKSSET